MDEGWGGGVGRRVVEEGWVETGGQWLGRHVGSMSMDGGGGQYPWTTQTAGDITNPHPPLLAYVVHALTKCLKVKRWWNRSHDGQRFAHIIGMLWSQLAHVS